MAILVISSKASGGQPRVLGYELKTVLSGSMEPTFMTGSVIAVKPVDDEEKKNLQKGDVITFIASDKKIITHRIMEIKTSGEFVMYKTKGDNNNAADIDLVLSDNITAVYTGFTVPYIGYFIDFAQSKEGSAILLIGPGLLLLGYAAFTIMLALRELDLKTNDKDTKGKPA